MIPPPTRPDLSALVTEANRRFPQGDGCPYRSCTPDMVVGLCLTCLIGCLLAALQARELASTWQPIASAPKMRKIVVSYINALGKRRVVLACYYTAKALEMHDDYSDVGEYDEATGASFAPAGWYEEHDNENPLMELAGEPTHWMPLPLPPSSQEPT